MVKGLTILCRPLLLLYLVAIAFASLHPEVKHLLQRLLGGQSVYKGIAHLQSNIVTLWLLLCTTVGGLM